MVYDIAISILGVAVFYIVAIMTNLAILVCTEKDTVRGLLLVLMFSAAIYLGAWVAVVYFIIGWLAQLDLSCSVFNAVEA